MNQTIATMYILQGNYSVNRSGIYTTIRMEVIRITIADSCIYICCWDGWELC